MGGLFTAGQLGVAFWVLDERQPSIELTLDALLQPLIETQERRSKEGPSAATVREQILQIEKEREADFAGLVLRDPQRVAGYEARIARLKVSRCVTSVVEDPRPGHLECALEQNGGQGLMARYSSRGIHRELSLLKRNPRNLEIVTRSLQSKTPEAAVQSECWGSIVRPVVGCLGLVFAEDLAALIKSQDPLACEFMKHLFLARVERPLLPNPWVRLPEFWGLQLERLVELRELAEPRLLRLSTAAADRLHRHSNKLSATASQPRHTSMATEVVAKLALILHLWKQTKSNEINLRTVESAIALTQTLIQQRDSTIEYATLTQAEKELRANAAILLAKLKSFDSPPTRRELYQKFNDERRALHDPPLEWLISTGQVKWVLGERLASTDNEP